jgi:hypothetical protein
MIPSSIVGDDHDAAVRKSALYSIFFDATNVNRRRTSLGSGRCRRLFSGRNLLA